MGGIAGVCSYLLGFGLPLDANIAVAALAGFSAIAWRREPRQARPPLIAPVAVLLAATAVSTATSIDLRRSLVLSAPLVPGTLLFLLLAWYRHQRFIPIVATTAVVLALAVSLSVLATAAGGDWRSLHTHVDAVGTPLLVEANDIALVGVLAPFACALVVSPAGHRRRSVGALSLLAAVIAICVLSSRTAVLTLIAGVATFAWLAAPWSRASGTAVATLLVSVVIVDASLGFPLSTKFRQMGDQRVALAWTAADMFADAPVLGHGPNTFARLSTRYRDTTPLPDWAPPLRQSHVWAHNLYLEFLAERGVVGFAALVLVITAAFRRLAAARRTGGPDVRVQAAAAAAALTAFCVAAIFESSFLRLWVVIVFFTLIGIAAQLPSERSCS